MAPLPENNTGCYFVDYTDGVNEHSLMVRFHDGEVSVPAAGDLIAAFWLAIEDSLYEITILGARYREANATVSIPVTWPGDSVYGADPMPVLLAPRETRYVGRSSTGRRVSYSIYGGKYTSPDIYRIVEPDNADFLAGHLAIDAASAELVFLTIDLNRPNLKNYVSVNFNSYWEREARP